VVCEKSTFAFPKPWQPDVQATLIVDGEQIALPPENQYVTRFDCFSKCIIDSTPPEYGVEDAIRRMRVIDAVLHSMATGVPQPVGSRPSRQP